MTRRGIYALALVALCLGAHPSRASAAPQEYEGRTIVAIEYRPAEQPYSREYLDRINPLKVGQPLRLANVRAAIERLYATGRYRNIIVDAGSAAGGVDLRITTEPNFFVGRVTVDRVPSPPNEGVLTNATRLELGTLYTEDAEQQAVRNLRELLQHNGFYQAKIASEFYPDPATQEMNVRFRIESGPRARYWAPVITGAPERDQHKIVDQTRWHGWFGWKKVTEARTDYGAQRVRNWYHKRERLEARAVVGRLDYDAEAVRVTPHLDIAPGPKIRIRVLGTKLSGGKMRQLIPVFEEQTVDRDLLVEGTRNLREYFESKGYFEAKVDFTTSNVGADGSAAEESIEYKVDLGDRHKVVAVTMSGNRYFDETTLRERMYVRPASFPQFRHGRYSEALLARDVEAIESLYRANGFRDVEVRSQVEHGIRGDHTLMAAHLTVKEGPQWLVAGLSLDGATEKNRGPVLEMVQEQEGQPFSEANIALDRDNVLEYYYNHGYVSATFDYSYAPAKKPNQMVVTYHIVEGAQRFLRQFLIVGGLESTDPGLVEERLLLNPGDPISRSRMLDTQRRLYDLGIFARVDMAIQDPGGNEADKNILLNFDEARKWTVTGGLGAEIAKIGGCSSCLEAPAGEAGFSPRVSFGLTRRNFLGTGHIVSFQSRVSTLEKRGVLTYTAPQFRANPNINLLFSAVYDDSRDVRTFTARRREASAQIGQRISRASTILYRLTYRRVSVSDLKVSPLLFPLSQPVRVGIAAVTWIQDRRDDPADSHRGMYNTLDLGLALKALASQAEYMRFLGRNSTYHPFGLGSRYVLARSLTFGVMEPFRNTQDIPLPERFFGGGPASHRGFPTNQAGPRDLETGFPLGGKAVLLNQVELRYPLLGENIRGVFFVDSGNIYTGVDTISFRVKQKNLEDFDYMVHAVGFGVRYRTPVGPVRIDLAYNLNPPRFFGCKGTVDQLVQFGCQDKAVQQISHFQFHFSLGQAF